MYLKASFLVVIVLGFLMPNPIFATPEDEVTIKQMEIKLRNVGHNILSCIGDHSSRVMPIEHKEDQYIVPFETAFEFDPDMIISVVKEVFADEESEESFLIEMRQKESKEVVHAFQIGNLNKSNVMPCSGRNVPKAYYEMVVTVLDFSEGNATDQNLNFNENVEVNRAGGMSLFQKISLLFGIALLILFFWLRNSNKKEKDPNIVNIGSSKFDKRNMELSINNEKIELSNKEAELLALLHTSVNEALEREIILNKVWGDEGDYIGRTLDVFISKLRKKLEPDSTVKIVNIRGVGYKLVMDVA